MALQVWLPLIGNLNNQGLANVGITNNNTTVDNSGKIGSCYSFNGSSAYLSFSNFLINSWSELSVAFWCYTSTNLNGLFCVRQSNTGIHGFTISESGINFRDSQHSSLTSFSFELPSSNTWTHYVITYNRGTFNVYKNGSNIVTQSYSDATMISSLSDIKIGRRTASSSRTFYNGKLNDVRIYDNCLTASEIREISKGLVLHYKLDDPYSESTVNLGNTSTTYSNQTEGNAYTATSWGGDAGTITYYKSGGYNNGPYKVYHKTATGTGGIYRKTANDITIVEGKTYTMSIYVKASRDYTDSVFSFNINGVTSSDSNHYITASSAVHFTTEWTRVERTFTASANDAGTYGEMSIIYNDDITDYYVYFSCFQIEEKNHATPFVIGTRNGTIFDCSGYNNNGTITGTLKVEGDSPKNSYATYFNGSSYITTSPGLISWSNFEQLTISAWMNPATTPSAYIGSIGIAHNGTYTSKAFAISNFAGRFYVNSTNGTGYVDTNSNLLCTLNEWHHYAATLNDTSLKMYIDGVLVKTDTISFGSATIHELPQFLVGIDLPGSDEIYTGRYSDVRIYATALSEDDIKKLYSLGAKIDNKYNLYTGEIVEYDVVSLINYTDTSLITMNGWSGSKSFSNGILTLTATNGWRCFCWNTSSYANSIIDVDFEYLFTDTTNKSSSVNPRLVLSSDTGYPTSSDSGYTLSWDNTTWTHVHTKLTANTYLKLFLRGVDNGVNSVVIQIKNMSVTLSTSSKDCITKNTQVKTCCIKEGDVGAKISEHSMTFNNTYEI